MSSAAQSLLSKQKQPEKGRFKEERKYTFHYQSLSNDPAGHLRKASPVSAKLKFHWNACDNAHNEVDAEDLHPETCGIVIGLIAGPQCQSFEDDDQRRESHRQLWEQIVERD